MQLDEKDNELRKYAEQLNSERALIAEQVECLLVLSIIVS